MTTIEISEKIKHDEFKGEILINKFRFVLALLYVLIVVLFAVLRRLEGLQPFPSYGFIPNNIFLLFSVILFIYFRIKQSSKGLGNAQKTLRPSFKYICVILDMTIISASILVGCTYPELDPPIAYLSIWALFYSVLILLGSFRYSIPCAIFSGIYAGVCYMIVVFLSRNALDLPYFFISGDKTIPVNFPVFNESFRAVAMIVTGAVTAIACKRHLLLFNDMIESKEAVARTASQTVEQTRNMAKTIKKSTDDIFQSSKKIFATANNQAASIQEIEATINENAQIAREISAKTADVAAIASKMETDVVNGFEVLEGNVEQMDDIKDKNDGVISGIFALEEKITRIRDIISTINTITDQTKMIAFNAALEAASAGEYGKRFSVVASEVNRLADDIAALTKQINIQAQEIHGSSSSLIVSGEESAKKIAKGNSMIRELENIFREIRSGAENTSNKAQTITISTLKQQKSTEQINIAITDISKGLSDFIQSTKIANSSAQELTEMIQKLDALLTEEKTDGRSNDQ